MHEKGKRKEEEIRDKSACVSGRRDRQDREWQSIQVSEPSPATDFSNGTPASIKDKDAPQTVAIDDDPFDSVISETTLSVYGKSFTFFNIGLIALHANLP